MIRARLQLTDQLLWIQDQSKEKGWSNDGGERERETERERDRIRVREYI